MTTLTMRWQWEGAPQTRVISDSHTLSIGRRADCDIVVSAPTISRQHAYIYAEAGVFYLRNVSQTNHVHVNEQVSLPPGKRVPLHNGDMFRVGPAYFHVVAVTVAVEPIASAPQIRCSHCGRNVEYKPEGFCQWCGTALSSGTTVYGKFV